MTAETSAHQHSGRLRWALLALVGVVGIVSATVAWRQQDRSARQTNEATAMRAHDLVGAVGDELRASLAGTSGIVRSDGSVDLDAFARFGLAVTQTSSLGALAYEPVVSESERAAFEASLGRPIMDRPSLGSPVSPPRPLHYPVQVVVPASERSAQLVGFDLLGDPVRAAAAERARDSGDVEISEPVPSEPTGNVSFFLVKAVYRPGPLDSVDERRAALVGFVSTAYTGAGLADRVRVATPPGARFRVSDGSQQLAVSDPAPAHGDPSTVEVAGRSWTLLVDGPATGDHGVAILLALGTVVLISGLVLAFRRSDRHNREVEQAAALVASAAHTTEKLAHLAQGLASRTSSDDVMTFLTTGVLGPVGAFHAAVAVIEGDHLRRHFTPGPVSEAAGTLLPDVVPLSTESPLANAARTGDVVLLSDVDALRREFPRLADGWAGLGFAATANLPLRDRRGQLIGALGIAWDHPIDLESERDILATIAGIAGQTLERARLVDRVRGQAQRSDALAALAEVLATARSSEEVARAVAKHGAPVVGAARATVAVVGADGDELTVHCAAPTGDVPSVTSEALDADGPWTGAIRGGELLLFPDRAVVPLRSSGGSHIGAIAFDWDAPPLELPVVELHSVADLCAQALERAQLSDAEHRLVVNLQSSLLTPLPTIAGLDAAARYLPAARSIGIGGDWYDVIERGDGRFAVVVGDVAGHGITAVGAMAQLRSTIGAIARLGTPVEEVFPVASTLIAVDERLVATAAFVEIDTHDGMLRYVCAGHPPPLLRTADGAVVTLDGGRQPLLGLPMQAAAAGTAPFPPGCMLLCYTDGLIERRDEPLDVSIDRLASHFATAGTGDASELVDWLLARSLQEGSTDDVAIALIRRTA